MADHITYEDARCVLCYGPISPGETYLVAYQGNPEDRRLAHADNRVGVFHVRHLLNVFNPAMINVRVFDNPMAGPNSQRVEIQVQP